MHAMEDVLRYENMPPNTFVWYEWMMDHYLR